MAHSSDIIYDNRPSDALTHEGVHKCDGFRLFEDKFNNFQNKSQGVVCVSQS